MSNSPPLEDILPPPEVNDFTIAWQIREDNDTATASQINSDPTLSFPEKVDRMADHRRWFRHSPEIMSIIDSFLATEWTLEETINGLAAPIDHLYTTADEGRAFYDAELTAKSQRQYHTPEKALENWGPEQDYPEPPALPEGESHPTCEGSLWVLWFTILHAAKRIHWEHPDQMRLVELVARLKHRPDPPLPTNMTIALSRNWIWSSGKVWSVLLLLGASGRESWNDSPGCGAGWTDVEVAAFRNVNAFVARLTAEGIYDFMLYGMWALRDALECVVTGRSSHKHTDYQTQMNSKAWEACLWVKLAGEYFWAKRVENEVEEKDVDLKLRDRKLPWTKNRAEEVSSGRWKFWIGRFEELSKDERLDGVVRDKCLEASHIMHNIAAF